MWLFFRFKLIYYVYILIYYTEFPSSLVYSRIVLQVKFLIVFPISRSKMQTIFPVHEINVLFCDWRSAIKSNRNVLNSQVNNWSWRLKIYNGVKSRSRVERLCRWTPSLLFTTSHRPPIAPFLPLLAPFLPFFIIEMQITLL